MTNFLLILSSNNNIKNLIINRQRRIKKSNNFYFKNFGELLLLCDKNSGFKYAAENNIYSFFLGKIYNEDDIIKNYFSGSFDKKYIYLKLFQKFGFEKTLNVINGDFTLFIYDRKKSKFFSNRDRFGINQLYYSKQKNSLMFSNRCRTLIKFGVNHEPDQNFVGRYAGAHYRYIDNYPHKSAYKFIKQLPASYFIETNLNDLKNKKNEYPKISRWWRPKIPKNLNLKYKKNISELSENYIDLILDSIKRRLKKTQNPCFTLSGGMDSSTVLSSSVQILGKKLPAITTVYDDKTYDESIDIKPMLKKNVTKWHKIKINSKNIDLKIIEANLAHDEPIPTATWLSDFFLKKRLNQLGYKICFNGLGGDQLNAGEHDYFHYFFADLKKTNKKLLDYEISKWKQLHNHPIYKKNIKKELSYLNIIVDPKKEGRCLYDKSRLFKYEKYVKNNFFNLDFKPKVANPFNDYLRNKTYQDTFYELMPCCLRSDQTNSNNFAIENQYPFLDYRLFEFMLNVPGNLKIKNGVTKHLLREATKKILPKETRNRVKKSGWNAPAHIWFNGKNSNLIDEILNSTSFKQRGIYNIEIVKKLYNEHKYIVKNKLKKENHMMFFWQFINLELWLQNLDNFNFQNEQLF